MAENKFEPKTTIQLSTGRYLSITEEDDQVLKWIKTHPAPQFLLVTRVWMTDNQGIPLKKQMVVRTSNVISIEPFEAEFNTG